MYSIAICIPTYKRPTLLKKLLSSIFESNIERLLVKKINVIIVDNDIERSAESIVESYNKNVLDIFTLYYNVYPEKGLSNVRNELIRLAIQLEPDFIDFIDDDEYVSAQWLTELIKAIENLNADAVRGPVLAITEEIVPEHIWYWFKRERYPDRSRIKTITTGNLIIRRSSLQKFNIRFDRRFNYRGSEDFFFGIQFIKKGAMVGWADNAITYENIPKNRTNIQWLFKRSFRGANNFMYSLKLDRQYLKMINKMLVSLLYILFGIIALIIIILPVKRRLWGILKISEGFGGLIGMTNLKYFGY